MTAAIILAAGGSSRLGFPKQTLLFKGNTLIEIAIDAALKAKCSPVIIVLGANAEVIEQGIKDRPVAIINNEEWADGMSSSIKTAIRYLEKNNEVKQALIMLCDQPFVSRALLVSLVSKQQQTGSKIVACSYGGTVGVPAIFNRSLFNELLLLKGQEGAKKIIIAHQDMLTTIPFEKGSIDIDTIADYEDLINPV